MVEGPHATADLPFEKQLLTPEQYQCQLILTSLRVSLVSMGLHSLPRYAVTVLAGRTVSSCSWPHTLGI